MTADDTNRSTGGISAIWLLPMVAVLVAAWLGWKTYREAGIEATLYFETGAGLKPGRTEVRYAGVPIGTVREVRLSTDLQGVVARVEFDKKVEQLLRTGSQFWLVSPKVSLSEVSGLETIVSGNYIRLLPGEGSPSREFQVLPEAPAYHQGIDEGLHVTLVADKRGSIEAGVQVYYREIPVGEVNGYELSEYSDKVHIHVTIENRYAPLVRTGTRFWNASGVDIDIGLLSGAEIRAESLSSLLKGGIAFATPEMPMAGERVDSGARFRLYPEPEADWPKWRPRIRLVAGDEPGPDFTNSPAADGKK